LSHPEPCFDPLDLTRYAFSVTFSSLLICMTAVECSRMRDHDGPQENKNEERK
jgi:hypothetical protein